VSHLIFIVIIAVVAMLKASAKKGSSGPPPLIPTTTARPPAQTEEERQRRFFEALGLPQGSAPPPLVKPRPPSANPMPLPRIDPGTGRLRRINTGLPPNVGGAPVQPAPRGVPAPVPVSWPVPTLVPESTVAPAVPIVEAAAARRPLASVPPAAAPSAPQPGAAVSALLLRLRDPVSIRQAIMLREILGPPKALQPLTTGIGTPWVGR
jgi:hypothetical protein